jgi:TfoX/Sxy family transcriptional regulator of competence genes
MAYSEKLADRIRAALDGRDDVVEKRMFGGVAFMVAGSMACGIVGNDLMARVGADRYDEALARPHARLMEFTGRPLRGFVLVDARGIRTAATLQRWVGEAVGFATSPEQVEKQKLKSRTKRPRKKAAPARRKIRDAERKTGR